MQKKLIGVSLSLLILFSFSFSLSEAIALTQGQIQAIISLVRAFGGDETTLKKVEDSLYGRTPTVVQPKTLEQSFCYNWTRNLRIGDKGPDVDALVNALFSNGVLDNRSRERILGKLEKDFDTNLAFAVTTFQEKYAAEILTPSKLKRGTGFVGASTRAKLNRLYGTCQQTVESSVQTRDVRRVSNAKQLQLALELYYDANGSYPATLLALTPKFIHAIPSGPLAGETYFYKALPDECRANCSNYHLGANLEDSKSPALQGDADANTTMDRSGINGNDVNSCFSRIPNRFCFDLSAKPISPTNSGSFTGQNPSGGEVWRGETPNPTGPRLPPMIDDVSGPTLLDVGATGTWIVRAHDPKNGQLTYTVDWGETGGLSNPTTFAPQTATFTHRYATAGYYRVTFTATDNTRLLAESKITVQVGSDPTQTDGSNRGGNTRRAGGSASPSLTVLTPNGGESWTIGTTQTIQWATNQAPSAVISVQLFKGSNVVYRWDPPFPDHKISWNIASTSVFGVLVPGSDYTIRVTVDTSPNNISGDDVIKDDSYSSFTIATTSPMTDTEIITALEEAVRAHSCTSSNIGNCDSYFDLNDDGVVNTLDESRMRLILNQTYSEFDKIYRKIIAAVDARMGLKTGDANYESKFDANRNGTIDSDDRSRISSAMIGTRIYLTYTLEPDKTYFFKLPGGAQLLSALDLYTKIGDGFVKGVPTTADQIQSPIYVDGAIGYSIYYYRSGSSVGGIGWRSFINPNALATSTPNQYIAIKKLTTGGRTTEWVPPSGTVYYGDSSAAGNPNGVRWLEDFKKDYPAPNPTPSITLEPGKTYFFKLPGGVQQLSDLDSYVKDGTGFVKGGSTSADFIQNPIYVNNAIGYTTYYYKTVGLFGGIGWRSVSDAATPATSTPNNYIIISKTITGGRTTEWVPPSGTVYYGDASAAGNPNGVRWLNDFKKEYPASTTNRPPAFKAAPTGPASINSGEQGTWIFHAGDPDGRSLTYTASWGDNTVGDSGVRAVSPNVSSTFTFTHTYRSPGTYTITFGLRDSEGAYTTATKAVEVVAPTYTLEPDKTYFFKLPGGAQLLSDLDAYVKDGQGFVKGSDASSADQILNPQNGATISYATFFNKNTSFLGGTGWRSASDLFTPATSTSNQYLIIKKLGTGGRTTEWVPPSGTVYYGDSSATGNPNGVRWLEDFKNDYPSSVSNVVLSGVCGSESSQYAPYAAGFTAGKVRFGGVSYDVPVVVGLYGSGVMDLYVIKYSSGPSVGSVPAGSTPPGSYPFVKFGNARWGTNGALESISHLNGFCSNWQRIVQPSYTLEPGKAYFFKLPGGAQLLADLDAYVKDGQGFVKGGSTTADQLMSPYWPSTGVLTYQTFYFRDLRLLSADDYGWRSTASPLTPAISTPNNYLIINKGGTASRVIEWMPPAGTIYYGDNSAIGNPNGVRWLEDFKRDYPGPVSNAASPGSSHSSLLANIWQALKNLLGAK